MLAARQALLTWLECCTASRPKRSDARSENGNWRSCRCLPRRVDWHLSASSVGQNRLCSSFGPRAGATAVHKSKPCFRGLHNDKPSGVRGKSAGAISCGPGLSAACIAEARAAGGRPGQQPNSRSAQRAPKKPWSPSSSRERLWYDATSSGAASSPCSP